EARSAITSNRLLDLIAQNCSGLSDVPPEFIGRQNVQPFMFVPMRTYFMAGLSDVLNEPGKFLGDPAQYEERSLRSIFPEEFEYSTDVSFDPGSKRIPLLVTNVGSERLDMEVIFDVDSEDIPHGAHWCHDPLRTRTVLAVSKIMIKSRSHDRFLT